MSYSALAGLWVVEDECLVGLLAKAVVARVVETECLHFLHFSV